MIMIGRVWRVRLSTSPIIPFLGHTHMLMCKKQQFIEPTKLHHLDDFIVAAASAAAVVIVGGGVGVVVFLWFHFVFVGGGSMFS